MQVDRMKSARETFKGQVSEGTPLGKKVKKLQKEGMKARQAVAVALKMAKKVAKGAGKAVADRRRKPKIVKPWERKN